MANHRMDHTFPEQRLPFSEKNRTWRRKNVEYIVSQANEFYDSEYNRMYNNYRMYNDQIDQDEFRAWCDPLKLQSPEEGQDFLQAFNMGHNKIKIHLGELTRRPFYYTAVSTNPEDTNQIIREKQRQYKQYITSVLRQEVKKIQQDAQIKQLIESRGVSNAELRRIQEEFQKELQAEIEGIMDPKEIERRFNNYRLPKEKLINKILRQYELNHRIKYKKKESFEHKLISGVEAVMVEMIDGDAVVTPLNSLGVYYHKSPEEPFIQNGDYVCYKQQMTVGAILNKYGERMAEADYKKLQNYHNDEFGFGDAKLWSKDGYSPSNWEHRRHNRNRLYGNVGGGAVMPPGGYGPSRADENYLEVYHTFWRSQRKVSLLISTDEYGNETMEFYDEKYPIPENAVKVKYKNKFGVSRIKYEWDDGVSTFSLEYIWVDQIWKGIQIEDDIFLDIEPLEYNQPTIYRPYFAELPIYGMVSDSKNTSIVSLWDRIKPWQKLYYFVMSKFIKLIAQDQSVITLLNVLMIDPDIGIDKTMQYWFNNGLIPYNPLAHEEGTRMLHNMKAAEAVNLSNSQQISYYADILRFIEEMIGNSAGVPKSREGQTQQNTNVSDNRQDLTQASLISEPIFFEHEMLWEDVLNAVVRITLQNVDQKGIINRAILSDEEIGIIDVRELSNTDQMDIRVANSRRSHEIVELSKSHAQALIQNDRVTFSQFMELIGMENVAEFKSYIKEIEEQMQAQAEAAQQRELQNAEMLKRMEIDNREDEQQHEWDMQERKYVHEKELKAMDVYKFQDDLNKDQDGIPDPLEAFVKMRQLAQKDRELDIKEEDAREKRKIAKQKSTQRP